MIAPDMATMLCFIFTDAAIAQPVLQDLVAPHAATTFNCMTVDGDTSTSDTCLLFATGAAAKRGQKSVETAGAHARSVQRRPARGHARPRHPGGEGRRGPSKFVTIEIGGAESWAAARRIALCCANSPILKTAIFGEDPNWGRVVMAIGKAGEAADRDKLSIWFGPHIVARNGERAAEYVEEDGCGLHERPRDRHPRRCRRRLGQRPRCGPATSPTTTSPSTPTTAAEAVA